MYLNSFKMLNYNKIYKNQIFKTLNKSLINLPTPMNISLMWNFGSLLGVCLMIQILSGLFLAMHYIPNTNMAFQSVMHICRDVNMGWLLRNIHSNGASLFFICMFIHIGRGVYYESYLMTETWTMGVLILLLTMASAFLGYVLPWGQMSFWGATVITNLLSAIPFLGNMMVQWIWGGFSVDNSTLNRFFVFHFITPFIVLLLVLMHLMFLHEKGSNNPLGVSSKTFKIPFTPFFMLKDLMGFMMFFFMMMLIIFFFPYYLGDPDNFIMANSMVTPPHIKPEWYFLFAYAILRSISTKLGGVIALLMSILILAFMPFLNKKKKEQGKQFKMKMQFKYWMFVTTFMLLTWIGARPVELPYMKIGYWLTVTYFKLIIFMTKK